MRIRILPVACLVWIVLSSAQAQEQKKPAGASVLRLEAPRIFEQSVTHDLRLSEGRGEIELAVGELFEDDGPASGHSYQKPENRETVTSQTWIKKELLIPNPQARAAYLVVLSDVPVEALINGIAQHLGPNQSGRPLHQRYAFDPNLLQAGRNEIILRTSGRVTIARDDEFALGSRTRTRHPGRSAKSTDAGKTWDYGHLGPEGKLEGEYGVRVFLEHYRSQGSLTLPVLDAGNLEGSAVGAPITQTGPIEIAVEGETGPAGGILVRARTGDTYVPTEKHWSDWQELGETGGVLQSPRGRYVQVAVELSSRDPLQSPRLRGVRVEAKPTGPEDWTARLRVLEEHNEEIVRTSIPFEYEPLDHPRLQQLRQEYKLDEVVQGRHERAGADVAPGAMGQQLLGLAQSHQRVLPSLGCAGDPEAVPGWQAHRRFLPPVQPGVLAGLRELRVCGPRRFHQPRGLV